MLVVGKPHPHTTCVIHATGCYRVLGVCSDNGGLSDWHMRIFSHLLAEFLLPNVNGESVAGVDWFVECVKVGVDIGLGYCYVVTHEVVIDVVDGEPVETLIGLLECNEQPFVKCGGPYADFDATCVDILGPVDIQYLVFVP